MNNDLISREALKNAICEKGIKGYEEYNQGLATALDLIDLAPTVKINDKSLKIAQKSIELGLRVGKAEGKAERPKGEWIRTGSLGNGNAHYECSNCHYGDEHAESQEVPYCWHCGAKMQKGGAE